MNDRSTVEPTPPAERISYAEFLEWVPDEVRAEWVDGRVVLLNPPSLRHQDLADFLTALLRHHVEAHDLGVVFSAPHVKPAAGLPGRSPDIVFVHRDHRSRLRDVWIDGPADLVVEVVSPDSGRRDRVEKRPEYEAGGVSEYWIIDPDRERAEFWELREDGRYRPGVISDDGIYSSRVLPGLWLRVAWLWREPLPPLLSILREWKLA